MNNYESSRGAEHPLAAPEPKNAGVAQTVLKLRAVILSGSSVSGVALVIVLGMLVLVTVLVIAFFSSVSTEMQSSKSYASGTDVRTLADSAVNIVISQIQDATTSTGTSAGSPYSLAWASQPGMIRTYDNGGNLATAYKLYSSGTLRVTGSYNPVANLTNEIPTNWSAATNANMYTDLNNPVVVGSGSTAVSHYPIIDPSAVGPTQSGTTTALSGTYPPIQGCFLNTVTAITGTSATQTNPIPMPVQWLYVLTDGSVVPMVSGTVPGAGTILPNGTTDAIVGRIAFWTDDDTCKVNVNTASEGTFWDRPWITNATSLYEGSLSGSMPVQNEFQRYPGHPAMTSLSTVFPSLGGSPANNEIIYDNITPRLSGGGSKSGSVAVTATTAPLVPNTNHLYASVDEFLFSGTSIVSGTRQANPNNTGTFSQNDIERTRFFLTASSRAPEVNLFNKPRVTLWPLQANPSNVSNPTGSPDRNAVDNLIAFCSTIGASGTNPTPYYFQRYNTSTEGNLTSPPSASSQSPSADWNNIPRNQSLFAYLQSVTGNPIPGLGGSFLAKYGNNRDQILTEMLDFIRSNVNTFSTAYTPNYFYTPFSTTGFVTGQSQIVPMVVPSGSGRPYATQGFGRFSTINQAVLVFYMEDPLTISGTVPVNGVMMTGTVPTVFASGTTLTNYVIPDCSGFSVTGTNYTISADTASSSNIGAVLLLEPFCTTPGPPPFTSNARYVVNGLNQFTASSVNMGFPSQMVNLVNGCDDSINETAQANVEFLLQYLQSPTAPHSPKTLGATNPSNPNAALYPFYTTFQVSGTAPFSFNGGPISIQIYDGSPVALASSDLIQTINMNFPPVASLPVPRLGVRTVASGTTTVSLASSHNSLFSNYSNRLSYNSGLGTSSLTGGGDYRWGIFEDDPSPQHNPLPLIIGNGTTLGDTVRGVEPRYLGPAAGDYRLIAGSGSVPVDYFEGHGSTDTAYGTGPLYSGTSRLVHFLHVTELGVDDTSSSNGYYDGTGASGDAQGQLLRAVTYNPQYAGDQARNGTLPASPRGLGYTPQLGAVMSSGSLGDWDTGIGSQPDGPYINKADEGDSNSSMGNLYYAYGGYITGGGVVESGASYSPNREIASAVAFGSLPTGINPSNYDSSQPWQTLLFCKNPLSGTSHPGFGVPVNSGTYVAPPYATPPDNAFLDLFTMPIVEPYAISDPFSTAGKVNMNYQIVPFTYLTRDTAVRAVLNATNIMAIPTNKGSDYKSNTSGTKWDCRYTINPDEIVGTLAGFEQRWATGDIFRSASEICDIYLVPWQGVTSSALSLTTANLGYTTMASWWLGASATSTNGYKLTGDNVREQPYGQIYPRLTTKSNTYTVHVQVQALKKSVNTPVNQFVTGQDQVTGEFRGAFIVERYLDPNSDSLVHAGTTTAANETDSDAMVGPYKYRIVSSKRFAP